MAALYGVVSGGPVSAGYSHTLALTPDGTVWAWGGNGRGELGDGSETDRYTPVRVTGLTGVIQVSAGASHSLALRSDGTVWAWGRNDAGQVGNGTISSAQDTPVQVAGLTGVTKVSAGFRFSLALRSDGTVRAWGANQLGQLGNGTTVNSPVPVKVTGLSKVTAISAGADSSLATRPGATTTSVLAWGGNSSGQLGDGTLANHATPKLVSGINTPFIAGIAAGVDYATVLGTDGSVWGWGNDRSGQLGNASASLPVTRPVNTIAAGSGITQFLAGQAVGLRGARAGRVRRVEHVDVDRDVHGPVADPGGDPLDKTRHADVLDLGGGHHLEAEFGVLGQVGVGVQRAADSRVHAAGPVKQASSNARRNGVPCVYAAPKYVSQCPRQTKKKSTRFSAVHGTSRYSISVSESSTALTAVSEPLVEMLWPMPYQIRASTRTVAARQIRLVRIVFNESMPVRTVSMPRRTRSCPWWPAGRSRTGTP